MIIIKKWLFPSYWPRTKGLIQVSHFTWALSYVYLATKPKYPPLVLHRSNPALTPFASGNHWREGLHLPAAALQHSSCTLSPLGSMTFLWQIGKGKRYRDFRGRALPVRQDVLLNKHVCLMRKWGFVGLHVKTLKALFAFLVFVFVHSLFVFPWSFSKISFDNPKLSQLCKEEQRKKPWCFVHNCTGVLKRKWSILASSDGAGPSREEMVRA